MLGLSGSRRLSLGEKVTAGSFPPFLPTTHSVAEVVGEVEAPRPRMYYYWVRARPGEGTATDKHTAHGKCERESAQ